MRVRGDPATPAGVVIAGVIAVAVVPGPWDWGSIMVGGVLLAVLFGYSRWPTELKPAIGSCAAVALAGLLLVAYPFDAFTGNKLSGAHDRPWTRPAPPAHLKKVLGEPETTACRPLTRASQAFVCDTNPPDPAGAWALVIVATLFVLSLAGWKLRDRRIKARLAASGMSDEAPVAFGQPAPPTKTPPSPRPLTTAEVLLGSLFC